MSARASCAEGAKSPESDQLIASAHVGHCKIGRCDA